MKLFHAPSPLHGQTQPKAAFRVMDGRHIATYANAILCADTPDEEHELSKFFEEWIRKQRRASATRARRKGQRHE